MNNENTLPNMLFHAMQSIFQRERHVRFEPRRLQARANFQVAERAIYGKFAACVSGERVLAASIIVAVIEKSRI